MLTPILWHRFQNIKVNRRRRAVWLTLRRMKRETKKLQVRHEEAVLPIELKKVSQKEAKEAVRVPEWSPAMVLAGDPTETITYMKEEMAQALARNKARVVLLALVEVFRLVEVYADLKALFIKHVPTHPAVFKFGYEFLAGNIMEGNACCKSMLKAFREVVHDYNTPPENGLSGDMIRKLNRQILFLKECCAQSPSMKNSFRFLKDSIDKIPSDMSHLVAKANLCSAIDHFIIEIVVAGKIIVGKAVTEINNGDVVLTYGSSSVIEKIFCHAFALGKEFHVVVVDSRPNLEGQVLLRSLVKLGISCKYAHITSIPYIMRDVTTVFLKGTSLFANGDMYARFGTECVSIVANSLNVPVLCCCETYMYSRISSDQFGDPLVQWGIDVNCLENWTEKENLKLPNLLYDVTSTDYFPTIINEIGIWRAVPEQE